MGAEGEGGLRAREFGSVWELGPLIPWLTGAWGLDAVLCPNRGVGGAPFALLFGQLVVQQKQKSRPWHIDRVRGTVR